MPEQATSRSRCDSAVHLQVKRLMPAGTDPRAMLLNDPSILLSTQRGRHRIGEPPDAEPDSSYLEPFVPPPQRQEEATGGGDANTG